MSAKQKRKIQSLLSYCSLRELGYIRLKIRATPKKIRLAIKQRLPVVSNFLHFRISIWLRLALQQQNNNKGYACPNTRILSLAQLTFTFAHWQSLPMPWRHRLTQKYHQYKVAVAISRAQWRCSDSFFFAISIPRIATISDSFLDSTFLPQILFVVLHLKIFFCFSKTFNLYWREYKRYLIFRLIR